MTDACAFGNNVAPIDGEMFACAAPQAFPVEQLRGDFPIFSQKMNGRPLVFLDSGASAQKPRAVLEAMQRFYERDYANIHRGVYALSVRATEKYEKTRDVVRRFIHAASPSEIVFTRGTTDAINLVAQSWGRTNLQEGDEVVLTQLEHHANIVPWQMLRDEKGIVLKFVPITQDGSIRTEDVAAALSPRTKLVAIAHVSNVLGTILPVKEIAKLAHNRGALFLVDGAQAIAHQAVDVQDIGADFYAFSGHKLYGPTGVGVLYARADILKDMPPAQGGGDMIATVSFEKTLYREPPYRFEAGTPIAEVIGLAAAIDYISAIGLARIAKHEEAVCAYATEKLAAIEGLKIHGTSAHKAGVLSFTLAGVHPHDLGTILDGEGVAVRAGHHCAEPLMGVLCVPATVRASLGLYTTTTDIDALVAAVLKAKELFS